MRRFFWVGPTLLLFALVAVGCGGSGGAGESPKVEKPTINVKPMDGKEGRGGPQFKQDN